MDIFQALILGIVEGITEFLPISSTGHMILASHMMKLAQSEFIKSFEIIIQLGAILAVVVLYFRTLIINLEVAKRVIVAFIPTAVIGFALYKFIKNYLLGSADVVLWALFIGGILLIVFEMLHKEKKDAKDDLAAISYKESLIIGVFQSLAVIPGVSRAAATIVGGLTVGLKRKTIVEFSFLLAVPTMLAATALDLMKSAPSFTPDEFIVLGVGFVVSFIVAILAIKLLLNYIKHNTFIPFGIYRIVLAALYWYYFQK
ncbi:MAG TPA: undecaprenyl-diphosphate phosphatase [Candidatus Omnitrophota bacterium]|nr:undecaprenyl-diphosphate phosphatase [Candidatus Omnitrophota bacterium]HPS20883.1 undecaprenyl-diphosphate phosphatase [Candidatus Omnitrophota bacterium]